MVHCAITCTTTAWLIRCITDAIHCAITCTTTAIYTLRLGYSSRYA